jgi:general secretion pathway protein H
MKIEIDRGRAGVVGYSLLEMLVVLAIIGALVAMAQPYFRGTPARIQLRIAAEGITSAMKSTRAAAIARSSEIALVFDLDRRVFSSVVVPATELPPAMRLDLKVADLSDQTASRPSIWFFPDGSSTGGDVVLTLDGASAKICTNWLSGIPRQDISC